MYFGRRMDAHFASNSLPIRAVFFFIYLYIVSDHNKLSIKIYLLDKNMKWAPLRKLGVAKHVLGRVLFLTLGFLNQRYSHWSPLWVCVKLTCSGSFTIWPALTCIQLSSMWHRYLLYLRLYLLLSFDSVLSLYFFGGTLFEPMILFTHCNSCLQGASTGTRLTLLWLLALFFCPCVLT